MKTLISIWGCLFLVTATGGPTRSMTHNPLPDYVQIKSVQPQKDDPLRQLSAPITFPLSDEDAHIIRTLEAKFDQEDNCAGLAAPQIGFNKQVIIFAAPHDETLKKWRPDFTQTMPKTIWINPSYEPIGSEMHEDYEACFSAPDLAGPVKRYKKIRYSATLPSGESVTGEAEGFLARMIQHEIGHVKGQCYVDLVPEGLLLPIEEYRAKRAKAMKEGRE